VHAAGRPTRIEKAVPFVVVLLLALQDPPAPADPPPPQDPAERAFLAEIGTERNPFPPVTARRRSIVDAAAAEKSESVAADDTVIGVAIGEEARAYPIEEVGSIEALNDVLGGKPILVTWCVRCQASIVYERAFEGRKLTFGCQRALYRGSAVLYDEELGSLWSQPMGWAGAGPLRDRILAPVESRLTSWANWREAHPETTVFVGGKSRRFQRSSFYVWNPNAELRLGVTVRIGSAARLYPLSHLPASGLFQNELDGTPVVVVFSAEHKVLAAYRRAAGGAPLELEPATKETPLSLADRQRGLRWRADSGKPLEPNPNAPPFEPLLAHPMSTARFKDFFPNGTVYDDVPKRGCSFDASRTSRRTVGLDATVRCYGVESPPGRGSAEPLPKERRPFAIFWPTSRARSKAAPAAVASPPAACDTPFAAAPATAPSPEPACRRISVTSPKATFCVAWIAEASAERCAPPSQRRKERQRSCTR
jgi:hypothetical protein